jgi:DNA ligase-1
MALKFQGCDLAHKWRPDKDDIKGWWMSEKLDGVRAIWDGENFLSRTGKLFHAPAWFKDGLPTTKMLDGELYIGRGLFQKTVGIVRNHREDLDEWQQITYAVFDAPMVPFGWENRIQIAQEEVKDLTNAITVTHIQARDAEHVMQVFGDIRGQGGEGVMLRKPGSMPAFKRTRNLLKVKGVIDGLAVVHSVQPGEGRHAGRMGALCVFPTEQANGCMMQTNAPEFKIGTGFTDADRERKDWVGTIVRWEAHELTNDGLPRHSRYIVDYKGD